MARDYSPERQPLLAEAADRSDAFIRDPHAEPTNIATPTTTTTAPAVAHPGLPRAQFLRAVVVGALILVILDTGLGAGDLALNALYESSLCYTQHPATRHLSLAERMADPRCKDESVQAALATLKGWVNTAVVVPGFLVGVPFGLLADRYGPQAVLMIIWAGDALYMLTQSVVAYYPGRFDIHWVFTATAFVFLGGGGPGLTAMMYSYAGGISSEANRSTVFLYVVAMQYLDSFVTGPVAYMTMSVGPLCATALCMSSFVVVFGLVFLLPTLPRVQARRDAEAAAALAGETATMEAPTKDKAQWYSSIVRAWRDAATAVRTVVSDNWYVGLLLVGLVFSTFGATEADVRVQYATKKYHWTWAQAGLINTARSAVSLPMVLVVLPAIALFLQKRMRLVPVVKDLYIARGSAIIMVTASVLQGLAPTGATFVGAVAFYELSRGYLPALLSVLAALAAAEHESMVYVCVTMMQALGMILAGPLLGQVQAVGFRMGRSWYGLPFVMCGCLQAVSMVFAYIVKVDGARSK